MKCSGYYHAKEAQCSMEYYNREIHNLGDFRILQPQESEELATLKSKGECDLGK